MCFACLRMGKAFFCFKFKLLSEIPSSDGGGILWAWSEAAERKRSRPSDKPKDTAESGKSFKKTKPPFKKF